MRIFKSVACGCLVAVFSILAYGCGGEIDTGLVPDESIGTQTSAISYGNNDCWFTGYYDEDWVDPANPDSGEHVVGWYQCSDYFASPISFYATIEAEGNVKNWMIWQSGSSTYMVFVDGWYYYWRRWVLGQPASTIFGNIILY
jgi:hypothetical protein